jgi:hypothetical protein
VKLKDFKISWACKVSCEKNESEKVLNGVWLCASTTVDRENRNTTNVSPVFEVLQRVQINLPKEIEHMPYHPVVVLMIRMCFGLPF